MKYLKVWTDFEDVLSTLGEDEVGRLFLAMLRYAATGEEPASFPGNERFIWPVAKRSIDLTATKANVLRENGLKPKSKQKQTEANESKQKQTEANETQKEKKGKEKKGNEMKSSFIDDDDAAAIQGEHDQVLNAAEDAGFARNTATRTILMKLFSQYGAQKMLDGIASCVKYGVPTIAYLEGCLKGEPRKAKTDVPAQKYEQRDYSGEQEEAMMRMIRGAG